MLVSEQSPELLPAPISPTAAHEEPTAPHLRLVPELLPDLEDPNVVAAIIAKDDDYIGDSLTAEEVLDITPVYHYAPGYRTEPVDHYLPSREVIRSAFEFKTAPIGRTALTTLQPTTATDVKSHDSYI